MNMVDWIVFGFAFIVLGGITSYVTAMIALCMYAMAYESCAWAMKTAKKIPEEVGNLWCACVPLLPEFLLTTEVKKRWAKAYLYAFMYSEVLRGTGRWEMKKPSGAITVYEYDPPVVTYTHMFRLARAFEYLERDGCIRLNDVWNQRGSRPMECALDLVNTLFSPAYKPSKKFG